jgi:PAS domain S-box-containing protein
MRRQRYFFNQLLILVAAVALPLLALQAFNHRESSRQARGLAYQSVENDARGVAQETETLLSDTRNYLEFLVKRPQVQALDSQHCDPLLDGVTQRRRHFANVYVVDQVGNLICEAVRGPGQSPATVAEKDWFHHAAGRDSLTLSKPFVEPSGKRRVSAMSLPMRDAAGRRVGTVSALLDLESLQSEWVRYALPANSRISILDQDGTLMVSRPGFDKLVGTDASAVLQKAKALNPDGVGVAPGVDGVERAYALRPIQTGNWQAGVAVPTEYVFGPSKAQLERSLTLSFIVIAAVFGFAVLMATRMVAPLAALAGAARAIGGGKTDVRASEGVPGEFRVVAQEFNAMLDARQSATARLVESERRYADLLGNVDMISLMIDATGAVTHANDYLCKLAGRTKAEMLGANWFTGFVPPELPEVETAFRAMMDGAPLIVHAEHGLVAEGGEHRLIQWHNSLLRSPEGYVVGIASLGVDITEARDARQREVRHLDFYRALSRTNGAIVRMPNAQMLYEEICRVCVEHGHASLAYVSVVERDALRHVAWAGPAKQFLQRGSIKIGGEGTERTGISGLAAWLGIRQISNDVASDPRTLPWRQFGDAVGTKALAAFPFRCGGRVAGTLTLHMTATGFFDDRVVDLVEEMTHDISFALDNFAREASRVESERKAEADSLRFRTLFQTAPVSMSIATVTDHRLLTVNEAYGRIVSQTPESLVGRNAFEEGLWPDQAAKDAFLREFASERRVRNFELRGTIGSGEEREFLLQADFVEFDEQRCVLTIANDVTDLRHAQRRISLHERQLSGLVDTAMDAIISIDATYRVSLFNRAAAELFLVSPKEALGSTLDRFIPTGLRAAHRTHVEQFARSGSGARQMGGLLDLMALKSDGTEFPIEASISKLGEGESVLMTVVIRDATEARLAEQGRLARVAAESASRAKTDFLSRMSHELRTPLNAILGFSQLLQSDLKEPLSESQNRQVEHVRLAGWHLLALINDVLDVSKIEAGQVFLEERGVDLLESLDEALQINQSAALEAQVEVVPTYRELRQAYVLADPRRLRQVMINLLSNAIKYNRPRGTVEVRTTSVHGETHIDVIDSGLGMDTEQLEHLYEPFNRLGREQNGIEGTGLGLGKVCTTRAAHAIRGDGQARSKVASMSELL